MEKTEWHPRVSNKALNELDPDNLASMQQLLLYTLEYINSKIYAEKEKFYDEYPAVHKDNQAAYSNKYGWVPTRRSGQYFGGNVTEHYELERGEWEHYFDFRARPLVLRHWNFAGQEFHYKVKMASGNIEMDELHFCNEVKDRSIKTLTHYYDFYDNKDRRIVDGMYYQDYEDYETKRKKVIKAIQNTRLDSSDFYFDLVPLSHETGRLRIFYEHGSQSQNKAIFHILACYFDIFVTPRVDYFKPESFDWRSPAMAGCVKRKSKIWADMEGSESVRNIIADATIFFADPDLYLVKSTSREPRWDSFGQPRAKLDTRKATGLDEDEFEEGGEYMCDATTIWLKIPVFLTHIVNKPDMDRTAVLKAMRDHLKILDDELASEKQFNTADMERWEEEFYVTLPVLRIEDDELVLKQAGTLLPDIRTDKHREETISQPDRTLYQTNDDTTSMPDTGFYQGKKKKINDSVRDMIGRWKHAQATLEEAERKREQLYAAQNATLVAQAGAMLIPNADSSASVAAAQNIVSTVSQIEKQRRDEEERRKQLAASMPRLENAMVKPALQQAAQTLSQCVELVEEETNSERLNRLKREKRQAAQNTAQPSQATSGAKTQALPSSGTEKLTKKNTIISEVEWAADNPTALHLNAQMYEWQMFVYLWPKEGPFTWHTTFSKKIQEQPAEFSPPAESPQIVIDDQRIESQNVTEEVEETNSERIERLKREKRAQQSNEIVRPPEIPPAYPEKDNSTTEPEKTKIVPQVTEEVKETNSERIERLKREKREQKIKEIVQPPENPPADPNQEKKSDIKSEAEPTVPPTTEPTEVQPEDMTTRPPEPVEPEVENVQPKETGTPTVENVQPENTQPPAEPTVEESETASEKIERRKRELAEKRRAAAQAATAVTETKEGSVKRDRPAVLRKEDSPKKPNLSAQLVLGPQLPDRVDSADDVPEFHRFNYDHIHDNKTMEALWGSRDTDYDDSRPKLQDQDMLDFQDRQEDGTFYERTAPDDIDPERIPGGDNLIPVQPGVGWIKSMEHTQHGTVDLNSMKVDGALIQYNPETREWVVNEQGNPRYLKIVKPGKWEEAGDEPTRGPQETDEEFQKRTDEWHRKVLFPEPVKDDGEDDEDYEDRLNQYKTSLRMMSRPLATHDAPKGVKFNRNLKELMGKLYKLKDRNLPVFLFTYETRRAKHNSDLSPDANEAAIATSLKTVHKMVTKAHYGLDLTQKSQSLFVNFLARHAEALYEKATTGRLMMGDGAVQNLPEDVHERQFMSRQFRLRV